LMHISPTARDALQGCVWEQDGQPVGMVNIGRDGTTDDWVIANVAVLPSYRRRGIARALVEAAIHLARQHHAQAVLLDVIAGNTPAYDLYTRLGFEDFSSSVTMRHAAPALLSPTQRLPVPAGYTLMTLSSQAWRPYFELAERITPPEVQRFRPITEQQFRMAASIRLIAVLLNTLSGVRERGLLVSTDTEHQVVAAIRLSAHTRGAEMNTCTMWLDPGRQELASYLVRSALRLSQQWSPRSRVELTVPTWEPALIEAATASEFVPAHQSHAMGMKLSSDVR
jgi:hypothetical protein